MRDLLFAMVWMVAMPLSIVSPASGVMIWVWVAMLSPNELLYGFMAGVPYNKMVAVTTVLLMAFNKEKKDFYLDPLLCTVVLLGLTATVSWLVAIVPSDDATDLYLKLIKEIVLTFAITMVITSRLRLHMLVLTIAISLSFLGVKEGLISVLTAGGHQIVGTGGIGDNNSLATALLMTLPFIYYLVRYSQVPLVRVGFAAAFGLSVITTIMTFSRGGFVGLVVFAALMTWRSRNRKLGLLLVIPAVLLVYTLAPEAWFARLNTIESAGSDGSFMGRVVAWKMSLLIALDHPLFGGGPHAVQRAFVWFLYRPHLPSVNFVTTPEADVVPHAAHSIFFEVLGDLGFVGLAIFLTMLFLAFWRCRGIAKLTKHRPDLQWAFDLARMAQISLVVYVVTAAALSMAYFELLYILIGLISRCHRTVLQEIAEGRGATSAVAQARPGGFVLGPLGAPAVARVIRPNRL